MTLNTLNLFRFKNLIGIAFLLFTGKVNAQEKKHKVNYEKEGYVKALVIKYNVEDCGFIIELDDKEKTKLTPYKLPNEFKKGKEKVWIKYSIVKTQLPSTCMTGRQVELEDIKKRE